MGRKGVSLVWLWILSVAAVVVCEGAAAAAAAKRNAYATMMYMGTPRDYEFYIATRVMLRSLRHLHVDADLVVIASMDVPSIGYKLSYSDRTKW
ncbi:UNVERIFIED_CONTAM: putative glucuronosyltransferase PGSIP8 [Sesamum radiatum]|uniref:Glucuronosyltransferase PGSIP8 n=1 Tax=Sesamum radiatum TaxID=300843 RepID=A0AAW2MDG5_SESRA